jgi:hypothetical protein
MYPTRDEREQTQAGPAPSSIPSGSSPSRSTPASPTICTQEPFDRILQEARRLFASRCPWPRFYDEILGPKGLLHQLLTTPEAIAEFVRSPAYKEIQDMLTQLRRRKLRRRGGETIKILTVRVPESFHQIIAREAAQAGVSINQLCVAKLIQVIDSKLLGTPSASDNLPGKAESSSVPAKAESSGEESRLVSPPEASAADSPPHQEIPGETGP